MMSMRKISANRDVVIAFILFIYMRPSMPQSVSCSMMIMILRMLRETGKWSKNESDCRQLIVS